LVLADIGNTHIHIWENGNIYDLTSPKKFSEKVYYISVNEEKEKEFLKLNDGINLKNFVKFNTNYKGLGIDRIMACKSINTGAVVDAGSAITVDIMKDGFHLGGIIAPGLFAFREAFVKISKVLQMKIEKFDYKKLPNNTNEALLSGSVGLIVNYLKNFEGPYYFTGGDGKFLAELIGGEYIKDLVFRGMIKTIKEDL